MIEIRKSNRPLMTMGMMLILLGAVSLGYAKMSQDQLAAKAAEAEAAVKVKLSGVDETVALIEHDGRMYYLLRHEDGSLERLDPQQFAQRVYDEQARRGLALRVLNITSPFGAVWVIIGFTGQLLFTGRMLVQWLTSEKARRSVVPTAFWWMSLTGATMLLIYFIWRKDIVGIFGQSTGWIIYTRNLWLIYMGKNAPPITEDKDQQLPPTEDPPLPGTRGAS